MQRSAGHAGSATYQPIAAGSVRWISRAPAMHRTTSTASALLQFATQPQPHIHFCTIHNTTLQAKHKIRIVNRNGQPVDEEEEGEGPSSSSGAGASTSKGGASGSGRGGVLVSKQ